MYLCDFTIFSAPNNTSIRLNKPWLTPAYCLTSSQLTGFWNKLSLVIVISLQKRSFLSSHHLQNDKTHLFSLCHDLFFTVITLSVRPFGYIQLATRGRQIHPPHPQWSHIGDTSGAAERGLPPRWEQVEGSQGRRSWTQEVWSYGLWVGIIICNTSPSYSVSNNRKISLFDEYSLSILEESVTKTGCDTWLKIFFESFFDIW